MATREPRRMLTRGLASSPCLVCGRGRFWLRALTLSPRYRKGRIDDSQTHGTLEWVQTASA